MGEAKLKRKSRAAILASKPDCIYCAGANIATTIEHMPPIQIFEGRRRPQGLEFPACADCNHKTSHSDLVGSLLARIWVDPNSTTQRTDFMKVFRGVANNIPGLLHEMEQGPDAKTKVNMQLPAGYHFLKADGPILRKHILTFAAKLGFALHREARGAAVPKLGGVLPMWFSNLQAMRGEIPQILFEMLPSPSTLQQGSKNVGDQFKYAYALGERDHMLYFATFNRSFAVGGVTASDRALFLEARRNENAPLFVPGDFRS